MTDRYQPYRQVAIEQNLDAVALVPGANFERLFNKSFHQNERPLLVLIPVAGVPSAVVPNLELGSFQLVSFEGEVFDWRDQDGYQPAFDALLASGSVQRIGVEGQSMRVFVQQALMSACPGLDIIDAQRAIAATRLVKSAAELDTLREAIRITEQALENTLDTVRTGQSETAIQSVLIQQLFGAGAEEFSFAPIVAAGDNAARPHAKARPDYQVQAGDALLIDFGARYGGLCADLTRTVFVGHYNDEQAELYNTVLAANQAGIEASLPGASAHAIDDAATRVLETSAYARYIRHKTGHGLGRDIHEDPYIMRGNQEIVAPGMVFTIEPGLYIDGQYGVRIEDDVLITGTGAESLTQASKALRVIAG